LLPGYLAVCYVDPGYVVRLIKLLPVVIIAVTFCCTLGLTCSAFVTNTARATVSAYVITGALFVVPMLAWWAGGNQLDARLAAWLAMPSPLVMAINLVQSGASATPMTQEILGYWSTHLWLMLGLCLSMLVVARLRLTALMRQG